MRESGRLRSSYFVAAYLFVFPTIVLLIVFRIVPMFASAYLSLAHYNFVMPALSKFIGLANYRHLVNDPYVFAALLNTVVYTVGSLVPGVVIAFVFALVITEPWFRFPAAARTIFFIPVVLSLTIASVLFSWLYHPTFGLLNYLLSFVRLPPVQWLGKPGLAMFSVVVMVIWKNLGYNIIIWSAGILAIPEEYRDSARIDGASWWQELRSVRLPLLRDVLLFLMVLGFLGAFQSFDSIYVMTYGGPFNSTRVIVFYLWQEAFQFMDMGYASAIAWFVFIILLGVTYLQFRLIRAGESS